MSYNISLLFKNYQKITLHMAVRWVPDVAKYMDDLL